MGVKSSQTAVNKENVYNFVKDNPHTTVMKIAKHFGFTKSQTDYYVRPMVLSGILVKTVRQTSQGRISSLTLGKKSFVRTVKTEEEKVEEELQIQLQEQTKLLPPEVQAQARLVRLSNRNMQPIYQKNKRRSGTGRGYGMQSSMGLFDVL